MAAPEEVLDITLCNMLHISSAYCIYLGFRYSAIDSN